MSHLTPGSRFALAVSSITLVFALLGAGLAWRDFSDERDNSVAETEELAVSAALNADRFLNDRLATLTAIAYAPPVRAGDVPGMTAYFQSIDPAKVGFGGGIGWVDSAGAKQAQTGVDPATLPIDVSQSEHVQTVLHSQTPYVGEAFVDGQTGMPVLPFAVPTFDFGGAFSGLVIGSIRLDLVEAAARERRFGTDDLFIIDRGGNIIIGPETVTQLVNVQSDPLYANIVQGNSGVMKNARGVTGAEDQVIGYATVPNHGWTILVERSENELYGDARRTFLIEIGGLALIWLVVTAAAFSVGRRISRETARTAAARAALEVREARLRSLTEATTLVNWTVNSTGVLLEPEKRWSALTGIPSDQLDHDTWLPYVHSDDREPGNTAWMNGIATGRMIEFEQRVTRPDGTERNYLVRAVPVRDPSGRIGEWIGVDIDVTQQRQVERSLRATADRLSLALEAGQLVTWDWDVQGDRIVWSETAVARFGPAPTSIGQFYGRIHPDDRDRVKEAIQRSLDERAPYEIEYRSVGPKGDERWVYVRGRAFHDDTGRPLRMIGVDVDVTERKSRELFEQDFVANVAHDIKNPLAAVKAQAQLLRRRVKAGRVDAESIDAVLSVLDSGLSRMNSRIEVLADVARLRAGRELELRKAPVNLGSLVRHQVESYQQTTEAHTIVFDAQEPDLVGFVDEGRIERVIDNLISNAVKYSPDGGEIRVTMDRDAVNPDFVRLAVSDHGIGIPPSDLPHIFDRYRRAGNTMAITGTGIGLAGVRQIVEQHGGIIEVESHEGAGSTFTVELPLTELAATQSQQMDESGEGSKESSATDDQVQSNLVGVPSAHGASVPGKPGSKPEGK
jgi:PAS domain S-box-containing protein